MESSPSRIKNNHETFSSAVLVRISLFFILSSSFMAVILVVSYLFTKLVEYSVGSRINRNTCKLARTPQIIKKIIKREKEKTPSLTLLDLDELQELDENGMKTINHLRVGAMIWNLPCKKPGLFDQHWFFFLLKKKYFFGL